MDVRCSRSGRCRRTASSCAATARARRSSSTPATRPTRIADAIDELELDVEAILLTHTHFDHVGAVAPLARHTGAPV